MIFQECLPADRVKATKQIAFHNKRTTFYKQNYTQNYVSLTNKRFPSIAILEKIAAHTPKRLKSAAISLIYQKYKKLAKLMFRSDNFRISRFSEAHARLYELIFYGSKFH